MEATIDLLADFGNSGTRINFLHADRRYIFNLPNKFGKVAADTKINKRYQNALTTILRVDGVIYCNGRIVEQEYNSTAIRPDSLTSKVDQDVTYVTLRLAIAKVYMILSRELGVDIKDLQLTLNISVLLPPIHVDTQSKKFSEKIASIKHVEILSPYYATPHFHVNSVEVYSEGVSAFTGAFYKEINHIFIDNSDAEEKGYMVVDNGSQIALVDVENNKAFMNGYVIVIDIGAGTTDVSIFRNLELLEKSKETFNIGGNLVHSELDRQYREAFGYRAEDSNILQSVLTGVLEEGSHKHIVDPMVLRAKEAYSDSIRSDIRKYLERISIDMKSISGILVCGGGAVPTVREGVEVVPAMSEVLLAYLKQLAPYIELLHTEGSLRDLNINGLYTLVKYSS